MSDKPTIGEINRNWWNCKNVPSKPWLGSTGTDEFGHAIFSEREHNGVIYRPEAWSCRAAIKNLWAYRRKRDANSLSEIFSIYAGSEDTIGSRPGGPRNNPDEYARFVAAKAGVTVGARLNLFDTSGKVIAPALLTGILDAMTRWENGKTFPDVADVIRDGLILYAEA